MDPEAVLLFLEINEETKPPAMTMQDRATAGASHTGHDTYIWRIRTGILDLNFFEIYVNLDEHLLHVRRSAHLSRDGASPLSFLREFLYFTTDYSL